MILRLVVAVVVLVAVAGAGTWGYRKHQRNQEYVAQCGPNGVRGDAAKLLDLHSRWQEAVRLAGVTSRIALGAQVQRLQGLRDEARTIGAGSKQLDLPRKLLTDGMSRIIGGFMAFMGQEEDAQAAAQISAGRLALEQFGKELESAITDCDLLDRRR